MRGTLTATAIALIVAGTYAISCWIWPLAKCWCCEGRGQHSPKGNARISRPCRWCRGAGRRWRVGRRFWNWARRHAREAN